jgi:hypothetical protein
MFLTSHKLTALIILLSPLSRSQSLGCDDFPCLPANVVDDKCVLGNNSFNILGASNTSISYNGQTATWTEGQMPVAGVSHSAALETLDQVFYLGLPPSESGKDTTQSLGGCALVFAATTVVLEDMDRKPERDCSDSLGEYCVNDLLKQVHAFSKSGEPTNCTDLAAHLLNTAPDSCTVGKFGKSWGYIETKGQQFNESFRWNRSF